LCDVRVAEKRGPMADQFKILAESLSLKHTSKVREKHGLLKRFYPWEVERSARVVAGLQLTFFGSRYRLPPLFKGIALLVAVELASRKCAGRVSTGCCGRTVCIVIAIQTVIDKMLQPCIILFRWGIAPASRFPVSRRWRWRRRHPLWIP
jgi:hypothetical protein